MAFKDILDTAKNETKDAVAITKQKAKISKERSAIKANYEKIGEYVYKNARALLADTPEMENLMVEIDKSFDIIRDCNEEIDRIKLN